VSLEEWGTTLAVNLCGVSVRSRSNGSDERPGVGPHRRCLVGLGEATGPRSGHGREFESRDGGPARTLAAEGGPNGVTADAVCPGSVRGPRVEVVIETHAAATDRSPEEVKRENGEDTLGDSFVESTNVGSFVASL